MEREDFKNPQNICRGAVLASLAVVLQVAPLLIPIIGVSISALSTLPVVLAVYSNVIIGILVYIVAGVLISFWSVPQSLMFIFTSGILGLSLGICMKKRLPFMVVVITSALLMSIGLLVVGGILKIPILPWLAGTKRVFLVPAILLSTTVYSTIWMLLIRALLSRMLKSTGL